ncbi:hypothetical protein [Pannonibacter indicus]|uniref:hypothetical protein n=1 Tax=Pannonibacter indicus TaxID=466044 RepID=UPI00391D1ECB
MTTNSNQNQDPTTNKAHLDPFNDLKRRVEITRDARFQANLRLERRNKSSYFYNINTIFVCDNTFASP